MMTNTATLTGPALDWAVAKAEGGYDLRLTKTYGTKTAWQYTLADDEDPERQDRVYLGDCAYSDDWSQGGPIIERERIDVFSVRNGGGWCAQSDVRVFNAYGPTPLIAAMRCYVASSLGDTVDIPQELLETL